MTNLFAEFARKTLIEKLGVSGEDLYSRVNARKPVEGALDRDEILDFIKTVENVIVAISGQDTANEIGIILRNKVQEIERSDIERKKSDTRSNEIEEFLGKHVLPRETDILDYAKYLTLKYGINSTQIEKELFNKAKSQIIRTITVKRIKEEIDGFLERYPQPEKRDIIDFVNYIRLSRINYPEKKLREDVEKERLYRKFYGQQEALEPTVLDQFINSVKAGKDKKDIERLMQRHGVSYLIKTEEGFSEKLLSEIIELIVPGKNEVNDVLAEMGLQHMMKTK